MEELDLLRMTEGSNSNCIDLRTASECNECEGPAVISVDQVAR